MTKIETKKKHKDTVNNSRIRAARKEALRQYNMINQEVRRYKRRGKGKFIDRLAKQAETAGKQHRMETFIRPDKEVSSKEKLRIKTHQG